MKQYHKINSIFMRDENRKLLYGHWVKVEHMLLKDIAWEATEKVDGTNIRVIIDGSNCIFRGKTDNASIPTPLLTHLSELFANWSDCYNDLFAKNEENLTLTIYGEGYGWKIQSGMAYSKTPQFIAFDVQINGRWQDQENARSICKIFGIDFVPRIKTGTLEELIAFVGKGFQSKVAKEEQIIAEGVVCRPFAMELFDRSGDRIIVKLKHKDLKHFAEGEE